MSSAALDIELVQTKPFAGQKPGTSGLRKTVSRRISRGQQRSDDGDGRSLVAQCCSGLIKPFVLCDCVPLSVCAHVQVKEVKQPHYLENFVQCIFDSLPASELTGSTLVLSGDGRYHNKEAAIMIMRMAAANGVKKIITGENAIMSTPCVSGVIRSAKAYGGIILTASHNPGGPVSHTRTFTLSVRATSRRSL